MLKGSCLCQGIAYEYDGEITELAVCHCDQCKRAQGTPFATNAPIERGRFRVTCGEHLLKSYCSSPGKQRVFCANCGSPLYSQRTEMPETIRLRVGTITDGEIPAPDYHIYCESAATWFEAPANTPRFQSNKPSLSEAE